MPVTQATNLRILYVDDDVDDCILLRESLAASKAQADLVIAYDGESAIRYLNTLPESDTPSLIILDLNMPRWDGKKTLGYLKADPKLSHIPVVVMSTSENGLEKDTCRNMGAASYFVKPFHFDGYKDIISAFLSFIPGQEGQA